MVYIDVVTKPLIPLLKCPTGKTCAGSMECNVRTRLPCDATYNVCSSSLSPTTDPVLQKDQLDDNNLASSHGDPIIWTFHDECYDLNKDGLWLATSHPDFDHEVKIAVYNDYMRELQVLTKSGHLLLSINNMGEVAKNNFPYDFSQ